MKQTIQPAAAGHAGKAANVPESRTAKAQNAAPAGRLRQLAAMMNGSSRGRQLTQLQEHCRQSPRVQNLTSLGAEINHGGAAQLQCAAQQSSPASFASSEAGVAQLRRRDNEIDEIPQAQPKTATESSPQMEAQTNDGEAADSTQPQLTEFQPSDEREPSQRKAMPSPAQAPVQLYKEVGKYHVANDDTAAVVNVTNNKELYATSERIDQANVALNRATANIRFEEGLNVVTGLREVKPVIHAASAKKNKLPGAVTPKSDDSPTTKTGVLLPSECEKGAISIIGAFLENQRLAGNTFDYEPREHEKARIANLIAQSTKSAHQKNLCYDDWVRREALTGKAAGLYNQLNRQNRIDAGPDLVAVRTEVRASDPALADDQFLANFQLNVDRYTTRVSKQAGAGVLEGMIRLLDDNVNAVERTVMADIDPTYAGLHQNVLDAKQVRAQLTQLYEAQEFPKAVIDTALNLAGQQANLTKYFRGKTGDPATYVNDLNIFAGSRMKSFLEGVVVAISREVVRLEGEREKRFGSSGNLNQAVDPEIGEAYGTVGGHFDMSSGGRWNWHWAGVVLKTPTDNVTMEAHASHRRDGETHNEHWDFKMYGRPQAEGNEGKTFHDIWRSQGFGKAPVTVLGRAYFHDPRIRQYELDALTAEELINYKGGVKALHAMMQELQTPLLPKEEMVAYYYANIDTILEITRDHLPPRYVEAELRPKLDPQREAMARLKNEERELREEIDDEVAVVQLAKEVSDKLLTVYSLMVNYKTIAKKRGTL